MKINNFIGSFVYRFISKLNIFFGKIMTYIDRKIEQRKNEKWSNLFQGSDKIVFSIKDLKLNLYKDSILSRFIYDGFEKEEVDFVLKTLNEDDIFIDIGSNIGLFSILASRKVGDKGQVICFEPAPKTYERLLENVELNQLKNIKAINLGLSDSEGELKFYYSDSGFDAWNSFAPDYRLKKSMVVKTSTLDKELGEINKSQVKLVKIDVEGWEKFVIKGGTLFFQNYSPIVIVEFTEENTFNAGYSVHDIFTELEKLGYEWFEIKNGDLVKEKRKLHYPYTNLVAKKRIL